MSREAGESQGRDGLRFTASRHLCAWMHEQRLSIAFTTYVAGKLFLLGTRGDGRLSVFERSFPRCMALHCTREALHLSSRALVWRLDNVLPDGEQGPDGYDAVFSPQAAWVTGDIDVHGIEQEAGGRIVLVNTLFSCLAALSERHSFAPLWMPPWISRLAAEDRCHLNGLALADGRPPVVSVLAASDTADGWRDHRLGGGKLIRVPSGEVLVDGLCMPHSPRWHDGRLWLLEAGTGTLGVVAADSGRFEPVTVLPGFSRGLALHGHYALVGLSLPRGDPSLEQIPLLSRLVQSGTRARCGLAVVDLRSGDMVHWLHVEGIIDEIFDVGVLPGVTRPMAVGIVADELERVFRVGPPEPPPGL